MYRRIAVLLALLVFVVPGVASAAPPWSPPQPLALESLTGLTANAGGLALAFGGATASGDLGPHTRASVFTGGAFAAPADLTPRNVDADVVAYGKSRLLAAGIRYAKRTQRVVMLRGRLTAGGATLGSPRALGPARLHAQQVALAANDEGAFAIVSAVCTKPDCRRVRVDLAMRGKSVRLAELSGPQVRVATAVNARGDALAVWTQGRSVYTRVRRAGGVLGKRRRAGAGVAGGPNLAPSAALGPHREKLVGWVAQHVSECEPSAGRVYAAQGSDGKPMTATLLGVIPAAGCGHYVSGAGTRVAFDAAGRRLVTYTSYDADHFTVWSGALSRSGDLVDAQRLSDPAVDTVLDDAVLLPSSGRPFPVMRSGIRGHDPAGGPVSLRAGDRETVLESHDPNALTSPIGAHAVALPDGRVIAVWSTLGQSAAYSTRAP